MLAELHGMRKLIANKSWFALTLYLCHNESSRLAFILAMAAVSMTEDPDRLKQLAETVYTGSKPFLDIEDPQEYVIAMVDAAIGKMSN